MFYIVTVVLIIVAIFAGIGLTLRVDKLAGDE